MTDAALTAHQIAAVQTALRHALGLAEERFPLPALIGMVSDEIEQLRAQGRSDDDIAELIGRAGAITVGAEEIAAHYASPEARGHHGEAA